MSGFAQRQAPALLAAGVCIGALIALVFPLTVLVSRSFGDGTFTFSHYVAYFETPGLSRAFINTAILGLLTVVLVIPLAFAFAYALERTLIPGKDILSAIASGPLLVPSLLPALALVCLFGRQGLFAGLSGGDIYGLHGVLLADAVATFPHALIILRTALSAADGRLYEQAEILGAGPWRIFRAITLPGARHGLVAASLAVFALTITDIGAPVVLGRDFNVMSLVIYKQVLGQQHFELGAVAAILLIMPSAVAILLERLAARRQAAMRSASATPLKLQPHKFRDVFLLSLCAFLAGCILLLLVTCQGATLVRLWPYDLSLTGQYYAFDRYDGGGWQALFNSASLAVAVALCGTTIAFCGAYVSERLQGVELLRGLFARLALLPAAVPGLALGLSYVLFFDDPANPLHLLYGSVVLLLMADVTHYYTVAHMTAVSAVRSIDKQLESAALTLGRGPLSVLWRVIAPMSAPALVEIALYFFVNAMTTVSVVVFLYPPTFKLASVAVLNMEDAGDLAPAAAMGMMIFYVNLFARIAGQSLIANMRQLSAPSSKFVAVSA